MGGRYNGIVEIRVRLPVAPLPNSTGLPSRMGADATRSNDPRRDGSIPLSVHGLGNWGSETLCKRLVLGFDSPQVHCLTTEESVNDQMKNWTWFRRIKTAFRHFIATLRGDTIIFKVQMYWKGKDLVLAPRHGVLRDCDNSYFEEEAEGRGVVLGTCPKDTRDESVFERPL